MRHRVFLQSASFAVVLLAFIAVRALVAAQTAGASQRPGTPTAYKAPRTAFGQPDLQGVWANNTATPFERLKEFGDRALLTDEEVARLQRHADEIFGSGADAAFGDDFFKAALADTSVAADRSSRSFDKVTGNYSAVWMVERQFDRRTSLITDPPDGRIPPLTPEAQQRLSQSSAARGVIGIGPANGPEDRPLSERCITFGFPDTLAGYNSYYQFVQSPTYLAVLSERIHDVRVIPLDGRPHPPSSVRLWLGDSRGHWQGDTLVVDSAGFNDRSWLDAFGHPHSEELRIQERFHRRDFGHLDLELTINDPKLFLKPFTVKVTELLDPDSDVLEMICNENEKDRPHLPSQSQLPSR